jgi:hypothetical protein
VDALRVDRVTAAGRRGSSRPLVVDTSAGPRLVKLRGAAQGTAPLVAEVIVGALADTAGLAVPARSLVELPAEIETADWDDELADLLAASVGVNVGFDFLAGARDVTVSEATHADPRWQARVMWLDRFVSNPDRTVRNPNVLAWSGGLWLIDHGAALGFHYDWRRVSEDSPRAGGLAPDAHLFESRVDAGALREADGELAPRLTREVLEAAVAAVPDSFLQPLVEDGPRALERRRAAYVAYLWKRLREPRPFLELRPLPPERPAQRPSWLARR